MSAVILGCSPKLDWRAVNTERLGYTALFPEKPKQAERTLPYAGLELQQTLEVTQIDDAIMSITTIAVPSSINAHRLVRYAVREGLGEMMVEALFYAYFADGADIGDVIRLATVAGRVGLDPHAALTFLRSGEEAEAVHTENLRAHRLGINGVPCFIIAGQQAIAGAQEPEVLERLLDVALQQYHYSWGDGR
jgi:predicted DsbA family dithiol-disulfide isomerase